MGTVIREREARRKAGNDGGKSFALAICNVAYFSAFSVGMASIGGFYEQFWSQWGDIFHCFKTCLIELNTKNQTLIRLNQPSLADDYKPTSARRQSVPGQGAEYYAHYPLHLESYARLKDPVSL